MAPSWAKDVRDGAVFRRLSAVTGAVYRDAVGGDDIIWMSTRTAAKRAGVTPRTLYRFIDEGAVPAYKMGRVLRLQQSEVDAFVESSRVVPGELRHLYPPGSTDGAAGADEEKRAAGD